LLMSTNILQIDPTRLGPEDNLQANIAEFENSLATMFNAIKESIRECP